MEGEAEEEAAGGGGGHAAARSRLSSSPLGLWAWGAMAAHRFGSPGHAASPPVPWFLQVVG